MDLFDQRAPVGLAEGETQGGSGDMKKNQYVLQLLGTPWNADTLTCILTAAEQGMEMESGFLNTLEGEQNSPDYKGIFEFGTYPSIKENDYFLAGATGVTSFINARGLGNSLVPKNVEKAAEHAYWIDVAITEVQPNVDVIVQEQLVGPMFDSGYASNEASLSEAKTQLASSLAMLEKQVGGKDCILDKYSVADVHWVTAIHLLSLADDSADLLNNYPGVQRWYKSHESRKGNSGHVPNPFSLLPGVDDIRNKKLSSVKISDF
ncbi:MAG: glutathione binding-like protein [Gammaproteobacteria bacterium]